MDPADWQEVLETNLTGVFNYSRDLIHDMIRQGGVILNKMVRELQIPTEWVKMVLVDQFHLPGMPAFSVPANFGQYIDKLKTWFPQETAAIDGFLDELQKAYLYGLLYYFKNVDNEQARGFGTFTVADKLEQHFRDPRLKTLLMAYTPHWGSLPGKTSYLFDAMLRLSYFLGNYYPRGSSQKFANDLGRALEVRGGKILKCASVERILIERGRAHGVRVSTASKRMSEQYVFRATVVISNADARHSYRDLIGPEHCGSWLLEYVQTLRPSYPCFLVHMGLRGMDPGKLAEAQGYYWSSCQPEDAMQNVFKDSTPVKNLYLTGHWTQPGGGVTPVIVSAARVAQMVLTGKDEGSRLSFRFSEKINHPAEV